MLSRKTLSVAAVFSGAVIGLAGCSEPSEDSAAESTTRANGSAAESDAPAAEGA